MFWAASVDIRRRKVSWMATSAGLEPSPPYSNCRGRGVRHRNAHHPHPMWVSVCPPRRPPSHLEAVAHCLAEPDVLLLLGVLAEVPVLLGDGGLGWVDAGLARLHVAVDLDGVQVAALVGVDPVLACGEGTGSGGAREGKRGAATVGGRMEARNGGEGQGMEVRSSLERWRAQGMEGSRERALGMEVRSR